MVGNVVAGGAGKTPLVIALTQHFKAGDLNVGVVSRGYGRIGEGCIEVQLTTPVAMSGDEPALIKQATDVPVFVASRRSDAVEYLLQAYPATDLVICDDGLQHYALQRDVEIAVFDDRGLGNGWLLPAGLLREPWPARKMRGIDLVLHTGQTAAFEGFTSTRRLANFAIDAKGGKTFLTQLQSEPLVALAGIATPDAFFSMLRSTGLQLQITFALPDHYDFKPWDENFFSQHCLNHTVLCTEKDAIKLFPKMGVSGQRILAVPLEFLPEPKFFTALDSVIAPILNQKRSKVPTIHGI
jgi:tetraacyldisaccharide 4'-kinase